MNIAIVLLMWSASHVVPSSTLAASAIAGILHLIRHIDATLPIHSYMMGHIHAITTARQGLHGPDPWPP